MDFAQVVHPQNFDLDNPLIQSEIFQVLVMQLQVLNPLNFHKHLSSLFCNIYIQLIWNQLKIPCAWGKFCIIIYLIWSLCSYREAGHLFINYIILLNKMHNLWSSIHKIFQEKAFLTPLIETLLLKARPSRKPYKLINISKLINFLTFPFRCSFMWDN